MNRYIVINPEAQWIQGDVVAASAQDAVAKTERWLTDGTDNAQWEVFPAPAGFPAQTDDYSGGDLALIAMVRSASAPKILSNSRYEAPAFAMAS